MREKTNYFKIYVKFSFILSSKDANIINHAYVFIHTIIANI